MAASTSLACPRIEANPDVTGLGIRISIYVLCLAGRLLTFFVSALARPEPAADFARSVRSALSIQGLALLCTAVYEAAARRLTLFHAVAVLHLLALLGINVAPRGRYTAGRPRAAAARVLALDAVLLASAALVFVALSAYVWATAPTFGSQPACNAGTVYVVAGVSIRATDRVFRWVVLATCAAGPAVLLLVLLLGMPCWVGLCCGHCGKRLGRGASGERDGDGNGDSLSSLSLEDDEREEDPDARLDRLANEGLRAAAYTAFSIYAVVSLEQMIDRNNVDREEEQWTFGQILAVFLLLGPAYEFVNVLLASMGSVRVRRSIRLRRPRRGD
ncbi:hypothetical protein NKR23_g8208 [Pleurostoma richardsiae]|uniref:Uncharacterized protein n=1 Tax=Pleurostoma richardsiae TaxID=41990 RepID=A0AA38RU13_9PEZI|nr:hypothetical protein NKR23_g8208 [Pleurostoma richardsiae]